MKRNRKEIILSTARQMIGRYGIRKTSLDELAKKAKVAKATIYNYFESKEQIYSEVLNQEADNMVRQIITLVEQKKSPLDKLRAFITVKYQQVKDQAAMLNANVRDDPYPILTRIISLRDRVFKNEIQLLKNIIEDGIKEGIFCVDNVLQAASAIDYALRGFELSSLFEDNEKNRAQHINDFYYLVCYGLKTQKGEN